MRKSTPCPMAAFIPSYCACPPSARLSVYAFSLWHAVAVGAFRADVCAPPPAASPGAHRRRHRPAPTSLACAVGDEGPPRLPPRAASARSDKASKVVNLRGYMHWFNACC